MDLTEDLTVTNISHKGPISLNPMKNPVLTHESHRERIRRATSTKNWTKGLAGALSLIAFSISSHAQMSQPAASPSTDRVTFARSIAGVVTGAPQTAANNSAALVRNELTQAEREATLDFSVALKMHNFAELQERGFIELVTKGAFSRKSPHASCRAIGVSPAKLLKALLKV